MNSLARLPVMSHEARVALVAAARRAQYSRYLGYRALGYSPRRAYLASVRPL